MFNLHLNAELSAGNPSVIASYKDKPLIPQTVDILTNNLLLIKSDLAQEGLSTSNEYEYNMHTPAILTLLACLAHK